MGNNRDNDQVVQPEFIVDPEEVNNPPLEDEEGNSRNIPDPNDTKPNYWDDEDDGIWKPREVLNPNYKWEPRLIPNPLYVKPPTYWDKLITEIKAALPWVTLGIVLTGILNTLLQGQEDRLLDVLKRNGGTHDNTNNTLRSVILAAMLGLATPLCSCGTLPLAANFVTHGVALESAVAFLTASQSAGLDSAAITYGLLGPLAAICRLVGAIVLAIAAGIACRTNTLTTSSIGDTKMSPCQSSICCDTDKAVKEEDSGCCTTSDQDAPKKKGSLLVSVAETPMKLWSEFSDIAIEILPTVLAGLAASTAALHYFASTISTYSATTGGDKAAARFLGRLILLASVTPLQLCEHSTATLAAGIQKAGGSIGLSFGFLLVAPAVNMPTLLLLLQFGGTISNVVGVVIAIITTALTMSYIVDGLGLELSLLGDSEDESSFQMAELPSWFVVAVPFLAASMFWTGLIRIVVKNYSKESRQNDDADAAVKPKFD